MKVLFINNNEENSNNYELIELLRNTDIEVTSIDIVKFNEEFFYHFMNFDFILIEFYDTVYFNSQSIKMYNNYSNILFVPIVYIFQSLDNIFLSKNIRLDSLDYVIHPFDSLDVLNKINPYISINNEKYFDNYKMIIKGKLLNKLEHQWKQPLNFISTNLLNVEIKSELDNLKHNDIEKMNRNIESAIIQISDNISLLNNYFQNSINKTNFSIESAIEKNLDILVHRINQNNIELQKDSKSLDKEINNYENEFVLNSMLFLYILVEWSIKEKEKNDEFIISLFCEQNEGDINLCISLNKCLPLNTMIEYYDIEFFLIKNLLAKTSMKYTTHLSKTNTLFQITVNKEKKL